MSDTFFSGSFTTDEPFPIGTPVEKIGGDYKFPGVVVAVFQKVSGEVRYVVECTAPDCKGILHIYSRKNLSSHPHDGK